MKNERLDSGKFEELIEMESGRMEDLSPEFGIIINNITLTEAFSFSYKTSFHFRQCIFAETLRFSRNSFDYDCSFERCCFLNGLHLIDLAGSKKITLANCKVKNTLTISGNIGHFFTYNTNIDEIIIGDNSNMNHIEIDGIETVPIKKISILANSSITNLHIANSDIEHLNIDNLAKNTQLFNCQINIFSFYRVRNNDNFKIVNCKALQLNNKKSAFRLNDTNLGKTEFFQFDFSSFDEVNIINSVLIDCLFINTAWSDNINSYSHDRKITRAQELANKREIYRQIKYALFKQGDSVNERMFHKLEMNIYNQILKWKPKNFSTKIILHLSSLSSNYGQSLLRPLLFLVIVNGFLFALLNYTSHLNLIPQKNIQPDDVVNMLSKFIWYLNPLHKNDELNGIPMIIDLLIRVVSSYSIYNIIRATRRFIK